MYEENYQNLAAAIIGQACEDYAYSLRNIPKYRKLYKNSEKAGDELGYKKYLKRYKKEVKLRDDCLDFFYHDMGSYMENPLNPDVLVARLKEIAKNKKEYEIIRILKNMTSLKEEDTII